MKHDEQHSIQDLIQIAHSFYAQGRLGEAVGVLDIALQARPDDADLWNDRGIMLRALRRFDEALQSYDQAILLSPGHSEAHYNKAAALELLGRWAEALTSYDRAIGARPNFAEAWNNRGSALMTLGRRSDGLSSYDRAIAHCPNYAEAHGNRAAALTSLGRYSEALESVGAAINLKPNVAEFHDHRGTALASLHQYEEALHSYDRAIALRPGFASAYSNRASVLLNLKRPWDAIASCDKALAITSGSAEACNNRGAALFELGSFAEAFVSFERATMLKPDYPSAWANRGMLLLLTGRAAEGWACWRERERLVRRKVPYTTAKPWVCGEDITGKTLFIEAVDGFGDAIQFCRRIADLEAQRAKIVCALPAALLTVLKDISPTAQFVEATTSFAEADRHVSLYNLAEGFPPDLARPETPYLKADADRAQKWKKHIGEKGFKVGICWQGSLADGSRSFPLGQFQPFGDIPGVRFISLQKEVSQKQLADFPANLHLETLGDSFDAGPDAFLDTAAVMENLDLIIAPDTAIAHLAGALGRPVWVALKYVPDWRWSLDRSDTPWYPTMCLFRQQSYGDWSAPFAQMAQQLAKVARSISS
jgi:tetratricopeptide (TPR) repeat protein